MLTQIISVSNGDVHITISVPDGAPLETLAEQFALGAVEVAKALNLPLDINISGEYAPTEEI